MAYPAPPTGPACEQVKALSVRSLAPDCGIPRLAAMDAWIDNVAVNDSAPPLGKIEQQHPAGPLGTPQLAQASGVHPCLRESSRSTRGGVAGPTPL